MNKLISIVLPVYNEQKNIPIIYSALKETLGHLSTYSYEIIFVDDGSTDQSWDAINALATSDTHISGIRLSRNFGHQVALSAGYDMAQGDIIISLDSDMQHPPSVIPAMITKWEQGSDIVYARRIDRNEDMFLKKLTARCFYSFLELIADIKIPPNVADFRLINKKVVHEIRRFKDHAPFLRGMIAWTGFKSDFVDFKCNERLHGTTAYTWKKMFKLALDGVIGFSTIPLKIAGVLGFCIMLSGCAGFIYLAFTRIVMNVHRPTFIWFILLNYFFLGALFIFVWFLGEYIGRMYAQQRGRPLYIIRETIK